MCFLRSRVCRRNCCIESDCYGRAQAVEWTDRLLKSRIHSHTVFTARLSAFSHGSNNCTSVAPMTQAFSASWASRWRVACSCQIRFSTLRPQLFR